MRPPAESAGRPVIAGGNRYRIRIVLSGQVPDDAGLRAHLDASDVLICADGGARHLHRLEILPDRLVGDLDSIDPADLSWLQEQGVPVERYPSVKDETDAELAIRTGLDILADKLGRAGPELSHEQIELSLLAALGGRPDHVLANQLLAVRLACQGYAVVLSDGQSRILPLIGPGTLELYFPDENEREKTIVSIIPVSSAVSGLSYTGLTFPLENATLSLGSCRGVSNRPLPGQKVTICLEKGALLVITTPEI